MRNECKENKGFTLMEVVIVLAVIAILGAIIVPSMIGYIDRARLRSDIQSARVVQSAIDLYRSEVGRDLGTAAAAAVEVGDDFFKALVDSGYLANTPLLQTENAAWSFNGGEQRLFINISNCSERVKNVQLSEIEERFVAK